VRWNFRRHEYTILRFSLESTGKQPKYREQAYQIFFRWILFMPSKTCTPAAAKDSCCRKRRIEQVHDNYKAKHYSSLLEFYLHDVKHL
jgi:hypothetical protein